MPGHESSLGRIFGVLAVFLIVGTPFAYLAWENLSLAISGMAGGRELGLMAVGLVALLMLAAILARYIRRLDADE